MRPREGKGVLIPGEFRGPCRRWARWFNLAKKGFDPFTGKLRCLLIAISLHQVTKSQHHLDFGSNTLLDSECQEMPLINCDECEHEVSTVAEVCPNCGYSIRGTKSDPKCNACSAAATTKCQRCGVLSCVEHVQPHHVGSYCPTCHSVKVEGMRMGWWLMGTFCFLYSLAMFVWYLNTH